MTYTSLKLLLFLPAVLLLYRCVPLKHRWLVLLAGSLAFYALNVSPAVLLFFLVHVMVSYGCGLLVQKHHTRTVLFCSIAVSALPLVLIKILPAGSIIVPLGVSFYSMQLIAWLADLYRGKAEIPQNPLRFLLFVSWFPQIIQGPIPRYEQLNVQLQEGHAYNEDEWNEAVFLILWGLFLKLMIADRAAPFVNEVFDHYTLYSGMYFWAAALLYSVQLYTDFLSCVRLCQGISLLFGIRLAENFNHPYQAKSVREFWQRWHMSLSVWLRDYIYIPLGGSRKGRTRRWFNIIIVFVVSGFWHGRGLNYLCWGLMHAFFEIAEDVLGKRRPASVCLTFLCVLAGWVVFRAPGLRAALTMFRSMFLNLQPAVLFDGSLLRLGMDGKDAVVLLMCLGLLFTVERFGAADLPAAFRTLSPWKRGLLAMLMITAVYVFGVYGHGFTTAGFIYGGF